MRKLLVGIMLSAVLAPSARAEVTWSGGVGIRHLIRELNDGLDTRNAASFNTSESTNLRWEMRATLGVLSKTEKVDFGFDMRTISPTANTSEWLAVNNAGDFAFGIGQAFGRFHTTVGECAMSLTAGRHKTVMLYDNMAQMLFDNDVRFDGFGWTFKHGSMGFNMAQYVLGSTNQGTPASTAAYNYSEATQDVANTRSRFAVLYSFQPFFEFNIGNDIKSLIAVGYHTWTGTGGNATTGWFSNTVHGGTAGTVGNVNPVIMDNSRQFQILSDTSLPYSLRFVAEYVRNKNVKYGTRTAMTDIDADNDALALSLGWGKPKKAGDFGAAYSFSNKGIASVLTSFTNGDIAADNVSHFFEVKYMAADSLSLTAKAQKHRQSASVGGDGQPMPAGSELRNQTQERYELVGTLAF